MRRLKIVIRLVPAIVLFAVSAQAEDSLSIGPRFHKETSYNADGFVGTNISNGRELPVYKHLVPLKD